MQKKIFITLIVTVTFWGCLSAPVPEYNNKLTGSWVYENPAYGGAKIIFTEDYLIRLDAGGALFNGTYEVDWSQNPVELNIYWESPEEGEDMDRYETIVKFLDDYKIILAANDIGAPRPTEFDDQSETLVKTEEE